MGWLAYLIGIIMVLSGINAGIFVIIFGMLCHWKFWVVGLISGVLAFIFIRG